VYLVTPPSVDPPPSGRDRGLLPPEAVREFRGYIEANQHFIPNYGERCRYGGDRDWFRGVNRKPNDQQADGQETADALNEEGSASAVSAANPAAQQLQQAA